MSFLNDSSEQYKKLIGISTTTPEQAPEEQGLGEEFMTGLKRGTEQTIGTLSGAVGLAGGLIEKVAPSTEVGEKMQKWGYESYLKHMQNVQEKYSPTVAGFSQIKSAKDAVHWFSGVIGELAPTAAEVMLSAALGGGIAGIAARKGGKKAIERIFEKQIAKEIESEVGKRAIAKFGREAAEAQIAKEIIKKAGATAGAWAGSTAMEAGGMYSESAQDVGLEKASPFTALALGMISGASEVISPSGQVMTKMGIGSIVRDFKKQFINLGGEAVLTRVGLKFGKDVLEEATQEGFQEFLNVVNDELNNPDVDHATKQNLIRILDASAAGAAGGVLFAGAKSLGRYNAMQQKKASDKFQEQMTEEEGEPEAPVQTDIFGTPYGQVVSTKQRNPINIVVPTQTEQAPETTEGWNAGFDIEKGPAQGYPFQIIPDTAYEAGQLESGQEITFVDNGKEKTGTITKLFPNGTASVNVGSKTVKVPLANQAPIAHIVDVETKQQQPFVDTEGIGDQFRMPDGTLRNDISLDLETNRFVDKEGTVVYPVIKSTTGVTSDKEKRGVLRTPEPQGEGTVQEQAAEQGSEEGATGELLQTPERTLTSKITGQPIPVATEAQEAAPAPTELPVTQEDAEALATITEPSEAPKKKGKKKTEAQPQYEATGIGPEESPGIEEKARKKGKKKEVELKVAGPEEVVAETPKKKKGVKLGPKTEEIVAEQAEEVPPEVTAPEKKTGKKLPKANVLDKGDNYTVEEITKTNDKGQKVFSRVAFYIDENGNQHIAGTIERPIYKTEKVNAKHKENDTLQLIQDAEDLHREFSEKADKETQDWADKNIKDMLYKEFGKEQTDTLTTSWFDVKEVKQTFKDYNDAKKGGDKEEIAVAAYNLGDIKKAIYEDAREQLTNIEAQKKKALEKKRAKEAKAEAKVEARETERQEGKKEPVTHGATLQAKIDAGSVLMDIDGRAFATKKDATARVSAVKRVVAELGFDPKKVSIIQTARLAESEDYRGGDITGTYVIRYTGKVGEGIESPLTHPYIKDVASVATEVKERKEAVVTHNGVKYRQPYQRIDKGLVSTSATLQEEVYFDNTEDNTRWKLVPQEKKVGKNMVETGKIYVVKVDPDQAYETHAGNVADWPTGDYKLFGSVVTKEGKINNEVLNWVTNHYYKNSPSSLIGKTFPFTKKTIFEKFVKNSGDKRLEVVPVAKDKGNKVIWGVLRKGDPLAAVYKTREEAINEGIPKIDPENTGNLVYVDEIKSGLNKGKFKVFVKQLREGVSVLRFLEDKIQIMEKITPEVAVRKTLTSAELENYFAEAVPEAEDRAKFTAELESRITKAAEKARLGDEPYVQRIVWDVVSKYVKPTRKGTLNRTQINKFKKQIYTDILEKYNTTYRSKKLGTKELDVLSKRVRDFTVELLGIKDTAFMNKIEKDFANLQRIGVRTNIYRTNETIKNDIDWNKEAKLKLSRDDKFNLISDLTGVQFPKAKAAISDKVMVGDIEKLQHKILSAPDAMEAQNILDDMYGEQDNFYQEAMYQHGLTLINNTWKINKHAPYIGITIKTGKTIGKIVGTENNDFIVKSVKTGNEFRISHSTFFRQGNNPIYYKQGKKWVKVTEGIQNPDFMMSADGWERVYNLSDEEFALESKKLLLKAKYRKEFRQSIPKLIKELTQSWVHKPEIFVVDSPEMYADPNFIKEHGRFVPGVVDSTAFIAGNMKVYVNAWKVFNKSHLTHSVLHEVVGHWGLRSVFGDSLNDVIVSMIKDIGVTEMAQYLQETGYDLKRKADGRWDKTDFQIAEEYASQIAGAGLKPSFIRRIITAIKMHFKRMGWNVRITDNDVIALVATSHKFVTEGKGTAKTYTELSLKDKKLISQMARETGQISKAFVPSTRADDISYLAEAIPELREEAPKRFADHGSFINKMVNKMTPLGNLVNKGKYLAVRYRTLGQLGQVETRTKQIYNLFKKQTADTPEIYKYLTTKNADPTAIKDKVLRNAAVRVKDELFQNGKDLVDRGLMAQEALDKWGGAYLPRVYLKHLLDSKQRNSFGSGKTLSGIYALPRTADEAYRKVIGEIKEPAYLSSRAYSIEARDVILFDWLNEISKDKQWVLPQSFVDYKGKKVTATYLKSVAEHLRKTADAAKLDVNNEMRLEAQRMETIANHAPEVPEHLTKDYRKLPSHSKYGRLAGMWVDKHIYNDIVETSTITTGEESYAEKVLGHNKMLTRLTKKWKWAKVAANIPAHFRNFATNQILLYLSGMSIGDVNKYYWKAFNDIKNDGKYWQIAKRYGVKEATFTNTEMWRVDRALKSTIRRHRENAGLLMTVWDNVANMMEYSVEKSGDLYQWSEALGKTAKLMYEIEQNNASEEHAALEAHKWLFDYSLVTPSMKYLRNAPIGVPFLTFNMKVLPRLVEVARMNAFRYVPFMLMPLVMAEAVKSAFDLDDTDYEKLMKIVPKWMQEKSNIYLLPMRDSKNRFQAVNVDYFLPWSPWWEAARDMKEGVIKGDVTKLGDMMKSFGLFGGPVPQAISAYQTGIDPFTGNEIFSDQDSWEDKYWKTTTWLWGMSAPTWITSNGFAGKVMDSLNTMERDTNNTQPTLAQAAMRMFGVNTYPVDAIKSRLQNIKSLNTELKAAKAKMTQEMKKYKFGTKAWKNARDEYRAIVLQKQDELRKYKQDTSLNKNLIAKLTR